VESKTFRFQRPEEFFRSEGEGVTADQVIDELIKQVALP